MSPNHALQPTVLAARFGPRLSANVIPQFHQHLDIPYIA
jgi:hypothetical protein